MLRITKKDLDVIKKIYEYRILTIPQIAALAFSTKYVARRRIKDLIDADLLEAKSRGFGRQRGRPERIISLSTEGIDLLRKKRIISSELAFESGENTIKNIDHQLLLNWFQLHLLQVEKLIQELKIEFISSTSPLYLREHSRYPIIYEKIKNPGDDKAFDFIPDAVFCIRHKQRDKSLLFFLEIDLGTEAIASAKRNKTDIRQKVLNYQAYFRLEKYKRYEDILHTRFNGFRVLFMANSQLRMHAICRLLQEMSSSDFILVSHHKAMFSKGLSDAIWIKGGNSSSPHSILGEKMGCSAPLFQMN